MPNVEQLTNGARTTLAAQMDADHTTCTVASELTYPTSGQWRFRIDNEIILATHNATARVWNLTRGQEGTTATSHTSGAAIVQVLTAGALDSLVSVYDEGTLVASTRTLNFVGAGVAVTNTSGTATVTVGGGTLGGGSGHTIEEDGSGLTPRTGLNFAGGLVASDNAGADRTDVTLDYGGTLAALGTASSAGTLSTVPRGDHVHPHGSLTSLPDAHHAQAHALTGADHTLTGLTTGHVLKATSATTAAFEDSAHASTHGVAGADPITADLGANARVGIRKNSGVTTYKRRRLNLLEGAGVSISATDDAADEEVDVRIALAGGVGAAVCVSVSNSGAISLANNTPAVLTFDTEAVDTTSFHSTSSNPSRLTVPTGSAGKYLAAGVVSFAASATGVRRVEVLKNGTTTVAEVQVAAVAAVSTVLTITTPPLDLAEADYLELRAYQNSGGALNVEASAYSPTFGLTLLATLSTGSGGHTVQDDGVSTTARTYLNFREGLAVTDEEGTDTTHVDLEQGAIDHGSISGLTDDDHSAYLLASAATSRAVFAADWGSLTSGSATALHSHAADHAALTLGADADALLGLTGQALSLDSQSANTVLAGPTTGAPADPTFRALVAADLPAMVGDTGSGGTKGAAPAPASGDAAAGKYLKADGTWATPSGTGMSNPLTTQDDLLVGGASGAPARLAKGSDGYVLTVDPSTHHLVWAAPAGGLTNPMATAGDLIVGGTSGTPAKLAKGSDSDVLTMSASTHLPVWAAPTSGMTNPLTAVGQLIYAGASQNYATVSLGASATASHSYSSSPANVIDANDGTSWDPISGNAVTGEWVRIDLGQARTIANFRVALDSYNPGARRVTYVLEYSQDDSTWSTAFNQSTLQAADETITLVAPTAARYWRLRATSGTTGWDWLVATVALFGSAAVTVLPGNATATRKFLREVGDGTTSGAPAWDTLLAADIPSLGATGTFTTADGKTVTVTGGKITSIV